MFFIFMFLSVELVFCIVLFFLSFCYDKMEDFQKLLYKVLFVVFQSQQSSLVRRLSRYTNNLKALIFVALK